jgi:AraC-like DNA-binding protein
MNKLITAYFHVVIGYCLKIGHLNSNIYIPTSAYLRNAIRSMWQTEGFTPFLKEHILPKGIIEIIFNFSKGASMEARLGDRLFRLPNCFINGFNKDPVQLELPEQQMFLGIQLQPLAVKNILGIQGCEISDMIIDLSIIDPGFHSLWHQLADQIHFDHRVSILSGWIEKKLPDWQPREKLINLFISGIHQHDISVTDLSRSLCYSPRQLSRKMTEATGMNTEEILLYKKYLHAMDLIHHTDLSLTQIAYQSHFSDQSHFIKSFKKYSAMTPGIYRARKSFMKGHIYENVR